MISVIIPVYNGAAYLAEALQSVAAQTHPPDEVIVVDDGSSDASAAIARGFAPPVACIQIAHAGGAAARNQGIAGAAGDWLAFLDADDLWTAEKLQLQAAVLKSEAEVDGVLGMVESFLSPELDDEQRRRLSVPAAVQTGYLIGALLVRKTSFLRVGYFDPTLRSGEFIDWWSRATQQGLNFKVLPQVVLRRRLHGQNHTLQHRETLQDFARVARAALERRRQKL